MEIPPSRRHPVSNPFSPRACKPAYRPSLRLLRGLGDGDPECVTAVVGSCRRRRPAAPRFSAFQARPTSAGPGRQSWENRRMVDAETKLIGRTLGGYTIE